MLRRQESLPKRTSSSNPPLGAHCRLDPERSQGTACRRDLPAGLKREPQAIGALVFDTATTTSVFMPVRQWLSHETLYLSVRGGQSKCL